MADAADPATLLGMSARELNELNGDDIDGIYLPLNQPTNLSGSHRAWLCCELVNKAFSQHLHCHELLSTLKPRPQF